MTDEELIARLRGWARDIQTGSTAIWAMDQDLKAAADRIEELVKERDSLLAGHRALNIGGARLQDRAEAAEARAERLEAALQKLACKCPSNCDWEHDDICPSWTARAALKGADHE